jgi:ankyrin repeat protein
MSFSSSILRISFFINDSFTLSSTLLKGSDAFSPLQYCFLHFAYGSLKRMRLDLVRALIEQKADMFAKDNFGRTPLMYAYISGDRQMTLHNI